MRLALHKDRLVFPRRCVDCGVAPDTSISLTAWRGVDLIAVSWGRTVDLDAPACHRCRRKRSRGRIGFYVALIVGTLMLPLVSVAFIEAGAHPGVAAAPAMLLMLYAIWWIRTRAVTVYDRVFSPLCFLRFEDDGMIELKFRDASLLHEVQQLSGLAAVPLQQVDYRAHAAPPPEPWQAEPHRTHYWWLALVLAVGGVVMSINFAVGLTSVRAAKEEGVLIWLLYVIGGRPLVCAMFGGVALLCAVGAYFWRQHELSS